MCIYSYVFMALLEFCVVTVVLGDYEFARALRRARVLDSQLVSPVSVRFLVFINIILGYAKGRVGFCLALG